MSMLNQEANILVKDISWLMSQHGNNFPWHGINITIHPDMRPAIQDSLSSLRQARLQDTGVTSPTLFVDSSTEYWGGVLFPGCGQEAINLKSTHKINDKIQKGQNALEAGAVLRGLETLTSLWK
eukprot:GHVR01011381.1.p1 GENE.GHVR01011381.1~~GHVR01011381.1.p1  ORF type:complete len:124 (-),score=11.91 GHVR01011381.1:222-593(-)